VRKMKKFHFKRRILEMYVELIVSINVKEVKTFADN